MLRLRHLVVPSALLLATAALTQDPLIRSEDWDAIIKEGKTHSQVMKHLDHLANDIGPRLTSSDNLQNACEWARDYLQSIGYENARLEKWGEYKVGFNRGPWSGEIVAPKSAAQSLEFVTRAWTHGTKGRQTGGVVVAPADMAAAEQLGKELAGKWLLRVSNGMQRRFAPRNLELTRYFEKAGVLGVISSARAPRNPALGELLITSGQPPANLDAIAKLPSITLKPSQFKTIQKLVDAGEDVQLSFDIRNHFKAGPIPLYNVIADLEGSEHPDEYVVVGGHIDSWDGATGTTDNGTGCATTIEAARILKKLGIQPRRTIRFMLWSGEEQGLQGSRAWVNKHRELVRNKVSACLVHDGGTNYAAGIQGPEKLLPILHHVFKGFDTIDSNYGFEVSQGGQISGSDHASFITAGVPGFFWVQRGKANYTHTHHTQYDTYDTAIADYQKQTSCVVALGALAIANLDSMLPRVQRNEMMARRGRGRGGIGFQLDEALVVLSVGKGTPAEASGIKKGDKLIRVGDIKVEDRRGLFRAFRGGAAGGQGGKLKLVFDRGGKEVVVEYERPRGRRRR